ncbi:MAG: DUF3298 domain-containing protein [Bacteroidota bacterium]
MRKALVYCIGVISIWGMAYYQAVAQDVTTESLSYTYKQEQRVWPPKTMSEDAKIAITLSYPVLKNDAQVTGLDSLDSYIERRLFAPLFQSEPIQSINQLEDQMVQEYTELLSQYPDYNFKWELDRNIKIIFNKSSLVSLRYSEFTYTGGAHPNSWELYTTFNYRTGQELVVKDYIKTDSLAALRKIAEARFRSLKGIPESASLKSYGYWFTNNKFTLSENVALGPKGIIFYYNNYEIAPYAMGATRLIIPYKVCKSLLKQEYNTIISS